MWHSNCSTLFCCGAIALVKTDSDFLNAESRGDSNRVPSSYISMSFLSTSAFMSYFSVNPTPAWMTVILSSSFPKEATHGVTISDNISFDKNLTREMVKGHIWHILQLTTEKNTLLFSTLLSLIVFDSLSHYPFGFAPNVKIFLLTLSKPFLFHEWWMLVSVPTHNSNFISLISFIALSQTERFPTYGSHTP